MPSESDALQRARARRSSGTMTDFDGGRLSLARRLARLPRTALAQEAGVSASAITQFEREQNNPTRAVAAKLALALGVPLDFFEEGLPVPRIPAQNAHFRSLRSTPAISRDRALAFAELAAAVVTVLEEYVDFPELNIETHVVDSTVSSAEIANITNDVRRALKIGPGPINHVVRTLEAAGVIVLAMPENVDSREVDAFSTDTGQRPLVLLSPGKNDRARSRFDAAHELGHLVMHPDVEPGSKIVEEQAQTFASQFLAPDDQLVHDLPIKLDWSALLEAKAKWKISLRALVFRAHRLGLWTDAAYMRANKQLSLEGNPERGNLGPREQPAALGRAMEMLADAGYSAEYLARASRLPLSALTEVTKAGSETRLTLAAADYSRG
ncbi:ImmA/IrrE family metallo-endopeptidase [Rathayibacter sp. VKM Ac-2856]|nr:ImmA/IrrE family metallo-endopeptidase [Rathayibacter sp. VKM Ac-2858]NQX21048.1 ImmA/IrrE family metallo-endopeptidase [Rathayibacter sp. VKM Ac-2856]